MTLGPFYFLTRVSASGVPQKEWCIVALKWKRSITWRWAFYWSPPRKLWSFTGYRYKKNDGLSFGLVMPVIGGLWFDSQRNMFRNSTGEYARQKGA